MSKAQLSVFGTANEIGSILADQLLTWIDASRAEGRQYILGCPTGRTPKPIYVAIADRLSKVPQDLSHVVLAMMDEYVVERRENAPAEKPWSCHYFARHEIIRRWNEHLTKEFALREDRVWFPDPAEPANYDERLAAAGGIDFFILASGASDGHVAFNPPGSARESQTRIVQLSEQTRRDNLQTFPAFGSIDAVPRHGVSVGIATITAARGGVMVLTGASKRESLSRILKAEHYDPQWPATIIHEFAAGEILADREAAAGLGETPI